MSPIFGRYLDSNPDIYQISRGATNLSTHTSLTQPPICLLSHPSPFLAIHPLLTHPSPRVTISVSPYQPSPYIATRLPTQPPISLFSHPSPATISLFSHPSLYLTIRLPTQPSISLLSHQGPYLATQFLYLATRLLTYFNVLARFGCSDEIKIEVCIFKAFTIKLKPRI